MSMHKYVEKDELKEILNRVYKSLLEKGYDPAGQLAGYILSEDPVYIPDYNNARGLIGHINRDDILRLIIESYFEVQIDPHG